MQSLRLLIATAVLAIAAAQPNRLSAWDPTARDKTEECRKYTEITTDVNAKCPLFLMCCKEADPLNGDKCQHRTANKCETNDDGELEFFACTYSNCTEMITTTTTTTTQSPRQINGASVYSAFLSASALLPLFF